MTSNNEKRKVLITGAGGKIGASLSKHHADTYDLRLHYRQLPENPGDGIDIVAADITDLEQTLPIAEDVDTIWHLAGDPRVPAPWESVYANTSWACEMCSKLPNRLEYGGWCSPLRTT